MWLSSAPPTHSQSSSQASILQVSGLVYQKWFGHHAASGLMFKELHLTAPKGWRKRMQPFGPVGILEIKGKGKAKIIEKVVASACSRAKLVHDPNAENGDDFVAQEQVQVSGGEPEWITLMFEQHQCDQAYLEGMWQKTSYRNGFKVITLTEAHSYQEPAPYPSDGGRTWSYLQLKLNH